MQSHTKKNWANKKGNKKKNRKHEKKLAINLKETWVRNENKDYSFKKKIFFGLTKFKFRRTKEQSQIIRELLPEDMIKKIQSAIDEKSQTLEWVYDNLVTQILLKPRNIF